MNKDCKNLGKYMKTGGPGRPKGGRNQCIEMLDKMLAEAGNKKALLKKWQEEFDQDPTKFWIKYVVPVLPKDLNLKTDELGGLKITLTKDE